MRTYRKRNLCKAGVWATVGSVLAGAALFGVPRAQAQNGIVHDGEYEFLRRQHGERWDAEDRRIDQELARIRERNGGKRPNIFYILIDDISFGQMGNRTLNYVTGVRTPHINQFAQQGMSLMRMWGCRCGPGRVSRT